MPEGRIDVSLTSPGEALKNSQGSPSDLQVSDERDTNTDKVSTEIDSRGEKRKHEVSEVAPVSPPLLSRCILDSSATDAVTQKDVERVYDGLREYLRNDRRKSKVQDLAKDGVSSAPQAGGVHPPSGMQKKQMRCSLTSCAKKDQYTKTRYGLLDPSGKPVVPQRLRALTPSEAASVWAKRQQTLAIQAGSSVREDDGREEQTRLGGGTGRPMTCPMFTHLRVKPTKNRLGALVGTQDARNISGDAIRLGSGLGFLTDETVANRSLLDADSRRLATGVAGTTREERDIRRMLRHDIGKLKGKLRWTKKQRAALTRVGVIMRRLPARALRHAWQR